MEILARNIADAYKKKHADSITPLDNWLKLVQLAKWRTPQDVKNVIRSVDFLADNRLIFNIGGNKYRLLAKVYFIMGKIRIEWIGTHAEYSKRRF